MTDHSIFTKLTQKWEASYHEDMAALNVRFAPANRACSNCCVHALPAPNTHITFIAQ